MRMLYPDPVLTANIYCEDHLDELLHQALAPFWRELARQDTQHICYLWIVRYARRGEHLKIRLHGPPDCRPAMERLLTEAVEPYLATLGEPEEGASRRSGKEAPPIDAEDRPDTDHPDRTLLWTQYHRSHVSLGGKPFLLDDSYASLFTRCLARGCEIVLDALEPDDLGRFPHKLRQSTLLKLLISGLVALGFSADKRAAYLAFHRDWLLRFSLLKRRVDREKTRDILAHFDRQTTQMASVQELLRRTLENHQRNHELEERSEMSAWSDALIDLLRYITPLCEDPDYHLDPYASDPVFSPIFKVFHGIANQLSLNMLDEAFAYHLLLHSLDQGNIHGAEADSRQGLPEIPVVI